MHTIIHKIKTALDNKDTKYIVTDIGKIFVCYLNDDNAYGIITGGLVINFHTYEYDSNKLYLYNNGHLVAHINGFYL